MPAKNLWRRIAVLVILVLFLTAPGSAVCGQGGKLVKVGTVSVLEGRATLTHMGQTKSVVVRVGTPVYQFDTVKTRPGGKLRIMFLDKSVISVGSNSSLKITQYVFNPQKKERSSSIRMLFGRIKCIVADLAGYKQKRFNVSTKTAVLGVRGTEFLVLTEEQKTRIATLKKSVDVVSTGKKAAGFVLDALKYTEVAAGQPPTEPVRLTIDVFNEMTQGLLSIDAVPPDELVNPPREEAPADEPAEQAPAEEPGDDSGPDSQSGETGTPSSGSGADAAGAVAGAAGTAAGAAAGATGQAAVTGAAAAGAAGTAAGAAGSAVSAAGSAAGAAAGAAAGTVAGALAGDDDDEDEAAPEEAPSSGESEPILTSHAADEPAAADETPAAETTPETQTAARTDEGGADEVEAGAAEEQAEAEPADEPYQYAGKVSLRRTQKHFSGDLHIQGSQRTTEKKYERVQEETPDALGANRFKDHGDGTVTDRLTGLMWYQDLYDETSASYAPFIVEKFNKKQFAGYTDWRLPTTEELFFLYLSVNDNKDIPIKLPPVGEGVWTGDEAEGGGVYAWFYSGLLSDSLDLRKAPESGTYSQHFVKPVRELGGF